MISSFIHFGQQSPDLNQMEMGRLNFFSIETCCCWLMDAAFQKNEKPTLLRVLE